MHRQLLPVLIIDQQDLDRELLTEQFVAAWPFAAHVAIEYAADGDEALRKARQLRLKLIVLNWPQPDLSSSDTLRLLRNEGVRLPVVVLAGFERDEMDEDIESLGAVFLHKSQLTAARFRNAVATALLLCKRVPETAVAAAC